MDLSIMYKSNKHPTGNDYLPVECSALDFREPSVTDLMGFFGNRGLVVSRQLQNEGALCDTNLLNSARRDPNLSTFVQLIELAGLQDLFLCAGPFTAIVPNNDAFDRLDPVLVESLLDPANREELQDLLLFHILPGAVFSSDLEEGDIPTLSGQSVSVDLSPVRFNGVTVVDADNAACNGVFHVVDSVLSGKSTSSMICRN